MRATRRPLVLVLVLVVLVVAAAAGSGRLLLWQQQCVAARARTVPVLCSLRGGGGEAECLGVSSRLYPQPASLRLRLRAAAAGNAPGPAYCASLLALQRGREGLSCQELLTFRDFTVGWAHHSDRLADDGSPMVVVNLLTSLAHMKQMTSNSSTSEFWDFTNSVFSVDSGLLTSVSFNREGGSRPCHISMANIYNLGGTSVEELSVYNNARSDTDIRFGPMPKLKELRLVNCYLALQKFPDDVHLQLPALERLDLSHNWLSSVPAWLAGLQSLRELDLSVAHLQRLSGQLPPLPRLVTLRLRDTALCCLHREPDAFLALPDLRLLDVSHNRLSSLGAALRPLHRLSVLDASYNRLVDYPQLRLYGRATLNLSHNHLDTLPHCAQFGSSNSSLTLELQNNQISHWDGDPDMLRCVDSLDLSDNSLENIGADMLASLEAVRAVWLGGNPVHCEGCAFQQFRDWLRTTPVAAWAGGGGGGSGGGAQAGAGAAAGLRCASPPAFRGLAVGAVVARDGWRACRAAAAQISASGDGDLLVVGLSLGTAALVLVAVAAGLCYRYRFELAYTAHLLSLRARARTGRREGGGSGDAGDVFLFDAFILYSGSDQSWVGGTLVPLLEAEPRYRVCLHERGVDSADTHSFSHLLDCSRHVIVVLSKGFLSSRWCLWEMELASHRTLEPSQREFIILLELEPLERSLLPRHLRFLMDTRTYLEWHQPADQHYEEQAFRRLQQALGPRIPTTSQSC